MLIGSSFPLSPRWRGRLFIVAMLYFTFLGGTFVTDLSFWPRVVHHLIVTAILGGWTISLWRRRMSLPATPLDRPIAAVLGAWVLATFLAVDPRVSMESLWQILVYVVFFYVLVDLMRRWGARAVLEPLFFSAAVVVLVGLIEFVSWYFGLGWLPMFRQGWPQIGGLSQPFPPVIYRLSFTLIVPTFLAGYLGLLIPVALAWAITAPSSTLQRGLLIWLTGAVIVLVLAFSRGGMVSLGVAMAVFAVLWFAGGSEWRERIQRVVRDWRVWVGASAVIIAAALVLFFWLGTGDLFGHGAGDRLREDLFYSGWRIGLSHPIFGVGPYGFGRAMRQFHDPTITGDYFTSAHDIPLQVFAESGILGIVALAWLLVSDVGLAWQRWREADGAERIRIAGIVAAIAGFAVQNLADTLVSMPVMLPLLCLGAYLAAPLAPPAGAKPTMMQRGARIVLTIGVVASIGGWAVSDAAQYHFNLALQAGSTGDLSTAVAEITEATREDPSMGYYAFQRAQYLGRLASQSNGYLSDALHAYDAALGYENTYALMRANHALLLAQSDAIDRATSEAHVAISLQPDSAYYWLLLATLQGQNGDQASAIQTYEKALELRPDWIGSGYWDATVTRSSGRYQFMAAHGLDRQWTAGQLDMLDPACWPANPPLSYVTYSTTGPVCRGELLLRIQKNPADALPYLDQAVAADKANAHIYLLRAEANWLRGNLDQAERDARTGLFLNDPHAYYILGKLAEVRGDELEAERLYRAGPPVVLKSEGWDVAVYQRRGDLTLLPQLDSPGPTRYDFAAWLALVDLYDREGRAGDAQAVRENILKFDPNFAFSLPGK